MADRKLTSNVFVESDDVGRGQWYGPDYPQNEVTATIAKQITNPAAWADRSADAGAGDLRFRADDFAASGELAKDGTPPSLRAGEGAAGERAELEKLTKDELAALAEARQVDVAKSATKAELVAALATAG